MTATNANDDTHVADPNIRWRFDEAVTDVFDKMLVSSIPGYDEMRRWTETLGSDQIQRTPMGRTPHVMDLGASRGDAVDPLMRRYPRCRFTLVEISEPMMGVLEQKYGDQNAVSLVSADLSEDVTWLQTSRVHLVQSVLTLMFVPIECRQRVIQAVHDCLEPGGMFLVVEKTLGENARSQQMLVDTYHAFKRAHGYTDENIERKRLSLKGSLVPLKTSWTIEMMRDAGFVDVTEYWRALQFVGIVGRRPS